MSRIVIVGAGLGGLAAAVLLAAAGHDVCLLEQADHVGGKLGRRIRAGHTFDTGPSLLTLPDVITGVLADTGGVPADLRLSRLDPLVRYHLPDGAVVDLPGHAGAHRDGSLAAALDAALGPPAGARWTALLAHGARLWAAVEDTFLTRPVGVAGLARLAVHRPGDLPLVAPWRTLRGLGRDLLADPRLVALLDRYATYSGSDPRRVPAAVAVIPYLEAEHGGWYVPGGLYRIAEAFERRARELGAAVQTGAEVTAVEFAGGRVHGVRLRDGTGLGADAVVADVDAAVLARLVPDRHTRLRVVGRRSASAFAVLLGLAGDGPPVHHTVAFPARYDAEFDALAAGRPAGDPAVYLACPPDPAAAPAGCRSAFVLVNAPRHEPVGGTDWDRRQLADTYADLVLDLLARRGVGLNGRIAFREIRTPADLERATGAPGGAVYGTSGDGLGALLRPANRSRVPGLFRVGGSAHPGGGLPLVVLGARIVARLLAERDQRS